MLTDTFTSDFAKVFTSNTLSRSDIISLVAGSYELTAEQAESELIKLFSVEVA